MIGQGRRAVRLGLDARIWERGRLGLLWSQVSHRDRNRDRGYTDRDHLLAAADWLCRAQDAMSDGGVCGRYHLRSGWTSSYPETTGYIIPTLLALEEHFGDPSFRDRAERCVRFLLQLQLQEGAFPGAEVHENRTRPSPFNTAQILGGLMAWHRVTGDDTALVAARRAADWLVEVQDPDGAFRRHFYLGLATTYSAHASCWLAEFGSYLDHEPYRAAAMRHLDWVLGHRDRETDWIDGCGFGAEDHAARRAVTHTRAYTLWGILASSIALERDDGLAVARAAAGRMARRIELSRWLPGVLDHRWRGCSDYACLTGNAQMALIWFRLDALEADERLVNAAFKAIDLVKVAQPMDVPEPGIRGGIPGSDPIWGDYLHLAVPNWSAKYFIDALLAKYAALRALRERAPLNGPLPESLPCTIPPAGEEHPATPVRVVMYTREESDKVPTMAEAWSEWGFRPDAVIIENPAEPGFAARLKTKIRAAGLRGLMARAMGRRGATPAAVSRPSSDSLSSQGVRSFCKVLEIPVVDVDSLDSEQGVEAVRTLDPDVAIHAGAGILRAAVLAIPRLGTLNAHMGLLPHYRGMNVAEWAALRGYSAVFQMPQVSRTGSK